MAIAVLGARILLGGLEPGTYRRGGSVHLRVWLAERLGGGQRRGEPGRGAVAGVLRPRAGQQGRQGRRPALRPAGDRDADAGAPLFHRTRGRPVRALDRRRPLPRRPDHRRQRRHHRRAHHAAARGGRRQERRRRPGLGRGRQGEERPVLEGLARGEVRQGPPPVAGPSAAPGAVVGGRLRRDVDAAGRAAAAGAGRRPGRDRLGRPRRRVADRRDRARRAVDTGGDAGRGGRLCGADGDRRACAVAVDCPRAITRCAAGSAGRCGRPSG